MTDPDRKIYLLGEVEQTARKLYQLREQLEEEKKAAQEAGATVREVFDAVANGVFNS